MSNTPESNDPRSPNPNDPANTPQSTIYDDTDPERPSSAEPSFPVLDYAKETPHDPYAALRLPVYRIYAASFVLAIVGGQIQSTAVAWDIYQRTRSDLSLGFIAGIQVIPLFLLALPAGHLADIVSRKRVLVITQFLLALWGVVMAGLVHYQSSSPLLISAMYGVILINAVTLTFARPARASLLPNLVPPSLFPNAVTWNSSMFELSTMAGPALAGFVVAFFGSSVAYLINGFMLLSCFFLTLMLPDAPRHQRTTAEPMLRELFSGVRFVFNTPILLATLTLDLFAVLLGGATYLLPIFAERLQHGSLGFGFLRAAPAVGALSMAIILAHLPPMKRAGRALLLAVAGFGFATIVFGLSTNYYLSLAMLVLTGAFDNISVVIRHTLVQLHTPDPMRGRVSAVNQIFIGSSNELGGLESGLTSRWFGPVASVVGGGIGTLFVVLMTALFAPPLRRLRRLQAPHR